MGARTRGVMDSVDLANLTPIHLNPGEFDRLILIHGSAGELRRMRTCPCARRDTRTPAANCETCGGTGRYYPAHLRSELVALDTQRNKTWKLSAVGNLPMGTLQLVFPSLIYPALGDMWLPEGEEHVVEEVLFRDGSLRVQDSILRANRFGPDQVKPALPTRKERLSYDSPCCIEDVSYFDAGKRLINAQPSSYHVGSDGTWTWRGSFGPPSGNGWTVRYRAPAAYVIHTSVPVYRTESDQAMPHRATALPLYQLAAEDLRKE